MKRKPIRKIQTPVATFRGNQLRKVITDIADLTRPQTYHPNAVARLEDKSEVERFVVHQLGHYGLIVWRWLKDRPDILNNVTHICIHKPTYIGAGYTMQAYGPAGVLLASDVP